jgi:MFS family permease
MLANPPSDTADGSDSALSWIRRPLAARRAVIIGSFLALSVSPTGIITQTMGLFVGPVTHEFGWTRTFFFLGPTTAGLICGALASFLGMLGDRVGIRPILLIGILIYGLALMSMSLLTGSVPAYFVQWIILFAAGLSQTSVLYSKAVSEWFADKRGLMLSIATSGLAAGSILVPLFASSLIARVGWRGAYVGLGALVLLVALPSVFFLVQEPARRQGPVGPVAVAEGLSLREAARTRTYWLLLLLFTLGNGALLSLVNNLVPVLTSHGIALPAAAAAVSALGASQGFTRLLSGYVLDKTSYARLATVWYVLATGGAALLGFAHTSLAGIGAGLLIGTAWGAENELAAYFTGRYFGLRSYGLILGTFSMMYTLGGMPIVLLTARVFDTYGKYDVALIGLASCLALSCLFAFSLGPYQFSKTGVRHTREGATPS